ncbi:hypothetical protein BJ508DRAFT_330795 [Ascobolus immersus RN42]|uniref:CCHC-type domain-containing protein n=1 Tax=Ascobolus immersus RN42 TaxID=1160509 RepID=A0A3N4I4N8_ASCIM|nr:hypothetical protein BJ508DRAFT_330795 [Ascobolus immersus RN42]
MSRRITRSQSQPPQTTISTSAPTNDIPSHPGLSPLEEEPSTLNSDSSSSNAAAPNPALTLQLILNRLDALESRTTQDPARSTLSMTTPSNPSPVTSAQPVIPEMTPSATNNAATPLASAPAQPLPLHSHSATSSSPHQSMFSTFGTPQDPDSIFPVGGLLNEPVSVRVIGQWFPSVRSDQIKAILRNELPPTEIAKLLNGSGSFGSSSSSRKRDASAVVARWNAQGLMELTMPETTEEDYQAWTFFQAWELFKGIFLWGAPPAQRGLLASALCIYTHTIHRLRRSYSWPAARSYHFAFHQQRMDDPTILFDPEAWKAVDPGLISELCLTSLPFQMQLDRNVRPRRQTALPSRPYSNSGTNQIPLGERIRFPDNSAFQGRRFPGICYHYNSKSGCNRTNCQWHHSCNRCGKDGHTALDCTSAHSTLVRQVH